MKEAFIDFIDRTKEATLEEKLYEHRYAILISALILLDFLFTMSVINYGVQSEIHSDAIVNIYPEVVVNIQTIKMGIIIKSLIMYPVCAWLAKEIPDK